MNKQEYYNILSSDKISNIPKYITKYSKGGKKFIYFLFPFSLSGTENLYLFPRNIIRRLNNELTFQEYYDMLILGISDPKDRPKCKHCGSECRFVLTSKVHGYREFCNDKLCKIRHVSNLVSKALKGRPLSDLNKLHLSQAKKGKKLTEEQRLKRPRGFRWHHSEETRRKLSLIARYRALSSRNYYKSGEFVSKKCNIPIKFLSSYEDDFLKICEFSKYVKRIKIPDPIEYNYTGRTHMYYPDFELVLDSGIKLIVEVKPMNFINSPQVISKRISALKWCNKNNYKYITVTEREIYKFSRHNIKSLNKNLDFYRLI